MLSPFTAAQPTLCCHLPAAAATPFLIHLCLLTARPAAQATLTCTATVANTGTLRLKTLSLAPSALGCTFTNNLEVAPGDFRTCTITKLVPWGNFTTPQNVSLDVTASAVRFDSALADPTVNDALLAAYYTTTQETVLQLQQAGIDPATVVASGRPQGICEMPYCSGCSAGAAAIDRQPIH